MEVSRLTMRLERSIGAENHARLEACVKEFARFSKGSRKLIRVVNGYVLTRSVIWRKKIIIIAFGRIDQRWAMVGVFIFYCCSNKLPQIKQFKTILQFL